MKGITAAEVGPISMKQPEYWKSGAATRECRQISVPALEFGIGIGAMFQTSAYFFLASQDHH